MQMITIPLSLFQNLCAADQRLSYLDSAGVDNWCGCEYAAELRKDAGEERIDDLTPEEFLEVAPYGYILSEA